MRETTTLPVYVIKDGIAKLRRYNVLDAQRKGNNIKVVHGNDSRIVLWENIDTTFFICGNGKWYHTRFKDEIKHARFQLVGMKFYTNSNDLIKEEKKNKKREITFTLSF